MYAPTTPPSLPQATSSGTSRPVGTTHHADHPDHADHAATAHPMRRRAPSGFTLIELVLALSIVAIMVTMLFSGLRVGLRAWQSGEDRAATSPALAQHDADVRGRSRRHVLVSGPARTGRQHAGPPVQGREGPRVLRHGTPPVAACDADSLRGGHACRSTRGPPRASPSAEGVAQLRSRSKRSRRALSIPPSPRCAFATCATPARGKRPGTASRSAPCPGRSR